MPLKRVESVLNPKLLKSTKDLTTRREAATYLKEAKKHYDIANFGRREDVQKVLYGNKKSQSPHARSRLASMTSDILPPTQLTKRKKEMEMLEDELNPLATYPGTENLRPELLNRLNTLILKKREVEEQDQFLRIMNKDVLLTGTTQAVELNSVSKMDPKHKKIDKVMVDSARKIQTEFLAVKKVRQ